MEYCGEVMNYKDFQERAEIMTEKIEVTTVNIS